MVRLWESKFLLTAFVRGAGSVKVRSIKSLNRTRNQQSKVPMIPFTRYLKLGVGVLCGLALCAGAAQAPQHINIKQLATRVEDVVVPLPNEIFGALNKLGTVNWKQHVRSDKGPNFTERPRIALLLGTVIADGFIAVQAEDADAVKDIGQRVLALAKGIGVGNSITPHAKAIIEAADKRNWENVRRELDRTQNSVQQAMNEVHDEKLSQLVSLGGWLRGTEVLTSVVKEHFSSDGAELLHQPDLLSYFQTRLQAMPEFNLPIIRQIQDALVEVKPLIDVGDRRIPPESVKKVTYVKQGFQVREDYWGGDLGSGEKKAVRQQLFKGNEYWFWLGTEVDKAKVSVHVYDSDGKLAEEPDGWEKGHFAGAHVIPKATGSYFIIVSVEESPEDRTHWALVYGFR
ncbi:MAG: hypothetical protein DMC60_05990 [Verrucomicrobia bacterium]|nr:MAG: hypothetical protein DMC60_05990 [Verrucomicrobiota bacterium]